jgi:hypothetical protein
MPSATSRRVQRWWVIILPLIVLLFPLLAIVRAIWSWFNTSRIVSWYPRLHWIEQNLDRFSSEQLDAQQAFLKDLDVSLPTRTRVSAGYLAAYYDMRTTVRFVSGRVAARRAELREMEAAGAAPMPDFEQAPPETVGRSTSWIADGPAVAVPCRRQYARADAPDPRPLGIPRAVGSGNKRQAAALS